MELVSYHLLTPRISILLLDVYKICTSLIMMLRKVKKKEKERKKKIIPSSESSTAVTIESAVFCDVTPFVLVYVYKLSEQPAAFVIRVDLCFMQGK